MSILEVLFTYWPLFLQGLAITMMYSLISVLIGTLLGAIIAMLRFKNNKILNVIIVSYINVIRGTPLYLQLLFFYIGVPMAIPAISGLPDDAFIITALVINSSAYVSEIIRAGINSVDKGQKEAAISLGMSERNCMNKIILPQAIKNIIPALGNEYIMMVKETSIASTLAVSELMYTRVILQNHFLFIQPLIIIAAIYFIVTYLLSKLVSLIELKLSVSD